MDRIVKPQVQRLELREFSERSLDPPGSSLMHTCLCSLHHGHQVLKLPFLELILAVIEYLIAAAHIVLGKTAQEVFMHI